MLFPAGLFFADCTGSTGCPHILCGGKSAPPGRCGSLFFIQRNIQKDFTKQIKMGNSQAAPQKLLPNAPECPILHFAAYAPFSAFVHYFAYSIARLSRIMFTLICPGYSKSFSILLQMSRAKSTILSSLIISGFTITRISLPA